MLTQLLVTLSLSILCLFSPFAEAWTGKIVFQDEFDGNSLDLNKWQYEEGATGFGSGNLECYVAGENNVEVRDGKLTIRAKIESRQGKDYTSGRIKQKGSGFTYGAYVARARLPLGKHLWPAFWMLTASSCKFEEIDIMEYRGQEPRNVEMSAHYGRTWAALVSKGVLKTTPSDLSADFHEFAILWLPNKLEWYVDNVKYAEQSLDPESWRNDPNKIPCGDNIQPFSEPNGFIFNLAVGGGFFANHGDLTVEEARQWPKNSFEIDWVRIYQE